MESKAFEKLYITQLKDVYSAANQVIDALPKIIKLASNKELRNFFKDLLEQSKIQTSRIENILKKLKQTKSVQENCNTVEEFIEEIDDWLEESDNKTIIDAGLILIYKKISHYQIAIYETSLSYARIFNFDKIIEALQSSLSEHYSANDRLDDIFEESCGILAK